MNSDSPCKVFLEKCFASATIIAEKHESHLCSPSMVRVKAGDVALPIAAGSGTLVAFCNKSTGAQISIFLISRGVRAIDRGGRAAGRGRAGTPRATPPRNSEEKIKNPSDCAPHNFSFSQHDAPPTARSDPFLLRIASHKPSYRPAIRGKFHIIYDIDVGGV